jgi:hypothetical protein
MMLRNLFACGCIAICGLSCIPSGLHAASTQTSPGAAPVLSAPSVPLIACDPYFSVWSPADRLAEADTVHWTGKPHPLHSMVRIDGKAFRLMGAEPASVPALAQTGTDILPTRTFCHFDGAGVRLSLVFTTPALPEDLMVYSRPVTYVSWEAQSTDGQSHSVQVYFDGSALLAVNTRDQAVEWEAASRNGLKVLKVGTVEQPILRRRGDDLRIDWGYFYVASRPGTLRPQRSSTDRQPVSNLPLTVRCPRRRHHPIFNVAGRIGTGNDARSRFCQQSPCGALPHPGL